MTATKAGHTGAPDIIAEFKQCLGTMSHSRAGWDYDLPRDQRAKEDREEREALARAREIWSENPARHEELREAFKAASPLARMAEIEQEGGVRNG